MNKELFEELKDHINREKLVHLTGDLIAIESHPKAPRLEEDIVYYVHNLLRLGGINAELQKVAEHRYNVVARIKGQDTSRALMLTGHLDTVEDYGCQGMFDQQIKENRIYGRGACDMKGPIASMITAFLTVAELNLKPSIDIILALVVDEEFKSIGTEALIKNGLKAEAAILGEPTNMDISIGNRGLEWIDIDIMGKSTHGGTAEEGINAISKAAKLISTIDSELLTKIALRVHPILGKSMMNYGVIRGGHQPSTVPDHCIIKIDRRWTNEENIHSIYEELQSIIDRLNLEDKDFHAVLSRDMSNMNEMEHLPVFIDKNHPMVQKLALAAKEVLGYNPAYNVFPGWTDASLIGNYANIPTVIFGPGDISCAHTERENIEIDQLYKASLIYAYMLLTYGKSL